MKISVITPAVRKDELAICYNSLQNQTLKDFEWIVCSPFRYSLSDKWILDLPLNPGDFMGENKAYNQLFSEVSGELVVTLNDSIYLKPDALQTFWDFYQQNQKSCLAMIGNHYETVDADGNGLNMTYEDVRATQIHSDFDTTTITNFDACCSSIPAKAVKEIGSIDPVWDKYCCFGIREFMYKVKQLGYTLYLTRLSGYLGQKHQKLYDSTNLWDEKFNEGEDFFYKRGNDL